VSNSTRKDAATEYLQQKIAVISYKHS